MAKETLTIIKLQVPAGGANPSPPVGPALGQHGLNIMDFCNAFNEKTKEVEKGLKVPVEITVFEDRTFTFITKSPPAAVLLLKAAGLQKASGEPNRNKVAKISLSEVKKIAEMKMEDLNSNDIDAAIKIISGTARSMGIEIKEHGSAKTVEQEVSHELEAPAEEAPAEETQEETPAEETQEEAPTEETQEEAPAEETQEEVTKSK